MSANLLQDSQGDAGIIVQDGTLTHLDAQVSADFNFKALHIGIDHVTVRYDQPSDSFEIDGGVTIGATAAGNSFVNISAQLGDNGTNPGIVIQGGQVQSVYIVVNGGFSLYGLTLQATALTIQYSSAADELEFSGGVSVALTDQFKFAASLAAPGLIINTQTGALSFGPSFDLAGSIQFSSVFSADVDVKYRPAGSSFDLDASATVHLPEDLDVSGTLHIVDGQLADISLAYDAMGGDGIELGTTGLFLTHLGGSLQNINDPVNISVAGDISLVFGPTVTIGGTGYPIVQADGSFLIDKDHLHLTADVNLIGGKLGDGQGSVDVNWTTGVYDINIPHIGLLDDTFNFGGDLTFDNQGDITLSAMADVRVPKDIPLIGGIELVSANFYLQIRPTLDDPTKNFGAAWTTLPVFGTVGVQVFLDGSNKFISGAPAMDPASAANGTIQTGFEYYRDFPLTAVPQGLQDEQFVITSSAFADPSFHTAFDSANFENYIYVDAFPPNVDDGNIGNHNAGSTPSYFSLDGNSYLPHAFASQKVAGHPEERLIEVPLAALGNPATLGDIRVHVFTAQDMTQSPPITASDGTHVASAPAFSIIPVYAQPTVKLSSFTPSADQNTDDFKVQGRLTTPDYEDTTISLYWYYNANTDIAGTDPPVHDGTLIDTVIVKKTTDGSGNVSYQLALRFGSHGQLENASFDLGTGAFTFDYIWNGFLDLANDPYNASTQPEYTFYAALVDSHDPVSYSAYTSFFTPPNPAPAFYSAPSFFALTTLAGGGLRAALTPPGAPEIDVRGRFFMNATLTAQGGTLVNGNNAPTSSITVTSLDPSANANIFGVYSDLQFQADPNLSGIGSLKLSADTMTPSGKKYTVTETIPVLPTDAHLVTTIGLDNNTPTDGTLVTITVTLANPGGPDAVAAPDAQVQIGLPVPLRGVDALSSEGTFDFATGVWSVGTLPIDTTTTQTLVIHALFHQGAAAAYPVTASARSAVASVFPDDATATTQLIADNGATLRLDTSAPARTVVVGQPYYNQQLGFTALATGAGGPYTFTAPYGGLPPGITLSSSGIPSGTPTRSGAFDFNVQATDRLGNVARAVFAIGVADATAFAGDSTFTVNLDTSTLTIPNTPVAFLASSTFGANPPAPVSVNSPFNHLTVDANTGMLTTDGNVAPGLYSIAVDQRFTCLDAQGNQNFYDNFLTPYYLLVQPAELAGGPLELQIFEAPGDGAVGQPYHAQFVNPTAIADPVVPDGPLVWSLAGGTLPAGLTLDSDGTLHGTPTQVGSTAFTIAAFDNLGLRILASFAQGDYSIEPGPLLLSPAAGQLPAGAVGAAYQQTFTGGGAQGGPYFFNVASGSSLPPGLNLDPLGALSGTPTAAGTYSFSITVEEDDSGPSFLTQTQQYTLTVGANPVTITPRTLPPAVAGTAMSPIALTGTGGSGLGAGYTFAVSAGALPAGVSLSSAGQLSGTPATAGIYKFTVTATDALGAAGSQAFTLNVASFPALTVGNVFARSLTAHGSLIEYDIVGAGVPGFSSYQILYGTPTAAGFYPLTIDEVDSGLPHLLQSFYVAVDPAVTVSAPAQTVGLVGASYSQPVSAQGGSGTGYTYQVTSGALPAGLALDSATGLIRGTFTTAGPSSCTITATDSAGGSGQVAVSFLTQPAIFASTNVPPLAVGRFIDVPFAAIGGTGGPYTYTVTGSTLPQGFTLTSAGVLSGLGAQPLTTTITVTVADVQGNQTAVAVPLTVFAPPALGPDNLAAAQVGASYSQALPSTGGSGPLTFSIDPSTPLPAGLSLTPAGVLMGKPTVGGAFAFIVNAADTRDNEVSFHFHLTIQPAPTPLAPTTPVSAAPGLNAPQLPAAPSVGDNANVSSSPSKPVNRGKSIRTFPAVRDKHTLVVPASRGLLESIVAVDRGPLHVALAKKPAVGKLTLNPDGAFSYKAPAHFRGVVTFEYRPVAGKTAGLPIKVLLTVK